MHSTLNDALMQYAKFRLQSNQIVKDARREGLRVPDGKFTDAKLLMAATTEGTALSVDSDVAGWGFFLATFKSDTHPKRIWIPVCRLFDGTYQVQ